MQHMLALETVIFVIFIALALIIFQKEKVYTYKQVKMRMTEEQCLEIGKFFICYDF